MKAKIKGLSTATGNRKQETGDYEQIKSSCVSSDFFPTIHSITSINSLTLPSAN